MVEIAAKFRGRAPLVMQYVAHEEMRKTRYHDMLRNDIREFVNMSSCITLGDMICISQEHEIELQL